MSQLRTPWRPGNAHGAPLRLVVEGHMGTACRFVEAEDQDIVDQAWSRHDNQSFEEVLCLVSLESYWSIHGSIALQFIIEQAGPYSHATRRLECGSQCD